MLDSFLGSSTEEVGTNTESTTNFSSLALVTIANCEVTNVGGADGADICFDAETDLDKLLYPFAESILNPVGGDFDTWTWSLCSQLHKFIYLQSQCNNVVVNRFISINLCLFSYIVCQFSLIIGPLDVNTCISWLCSFYLSPHFYSS